MQGKLVKNTHGYFAQLLTNLTSLVILRHGLGHPCVQFGGAFTIDSEQPLPGGNDRSRFVKLRVELNGNTDIVAMTELNYGTNLAAWFAALVDKVRDRESPFFFFQTSANDKDDDDQGMQLVE